jgi:hypothetical protein
MMQKVNIGDRVSWFSNTDLRGTVKGIFLTEYPFYIIWDNGKDDWYKGSDLRKILD